MVSAGHGPDSPSRHDLRTDQDRARRTDAVGLGFPNPEALSSWAGLTPRHRESDTKVARGHVTKQGSRLLRWALIEAIQRVPRDSVIGGVKDAVRDKRELRGFEVDDAARGAAECRG